MHGGGSPWTVLEGGPIRLAALLGVAWLLIAAQGVLALSGLRVDLGTLAVVYFALESAPFAGGVASLLVGYLADLSSGEARGLSSASMVLSFLLVRLSVSRSNSARGLMISAVAVLGTALTFLARLALESWVGPDLASWDQALSALPSMLLGAALLGYPTYRVMRLVDDRVRRREDDVAHRTLLPRR